MMGRTFFALRRPASIPPLGRTRAAGLMGRVLGHLADDSVVDMRGVLGKVEAADASSVTAVVAAWGTPVRITITDESNTKSSRE